ncbi:ATP-binding protein [Shewanella cyperi]|uniref:ATP-binding protein n=1 Tax=Shewanella cyperi TaxID=2814292 RepID=UPI001A946921|nr:ATP-binding protein [Shewanella cyperi]QSX41480.1 ATP-binding protein [Shewanella cyperi]
MKRLFVSLYLLLSLSVLGIGWTLDSLWQSKVADSHSEDAPLLALGQLLKAIPPAERAHFLEAMEPNPDFPLSLVNAADIAMGNNDQLSKNQLVTIRLDDSHEQHLLRLGEQVLVAGPVRVDPQENLRWLFTLFFYLLLAGVALVWVWPLSRDLRTLREAAAALGRARWDTRINLSKGSQVAALADTFNEMARHIGALIDDQKQLTNAVSHEIRTPLARLKFALALLPTHCPNPEKRTQLMQDMQLDIGEIEDLVQELLTYARLESQQAGIHFEPCELGALVQQGVERLGRRGGPQIQLELPATPLLIRADAALVERALQNLVTNAQRFAEKEVRVRLWQNHRGACIEVRDDGQGIPEAEQQRIFEPFYRLDSERNANKGHGLGLAIISRIMQRHKGKVVLSSQPGDTRFELRFPFNPD